MAVLNETTFENPQRGVAVMQAWTAWYPSYCVAEASRLMPSLQAQWPGERARRVRQSERRQLDRWCSDGEDVLACIGALSLDGEWVRKRLRLQRDRFAKLVAALVEMDALRVWSDGRMTVTAGGAYVQAALRARWLGEGSNAPDWVDPLPEGCSWTPNAGPTSDG